MFTKTFSLVLVTVTLCFAAEEYVSPFLNFDVDAFLQNTEQVTAFTNCVIASGTCTDLSALYKQDLPDAITTECSKCTVEQKTLAAKLVPAMQKNNPTAFDAYLKVVDPNNEHWANFKVAIGI